MREFPLLQSMDAPPGNLPAQSSSFVGREREVAELAALLKHARIVTLTGVGGVGKTRLALQVAAEVLPRFHQGAWLVELAAVRDPGAVVDAVAAVFGVTRSPGSGLVESLAGFLCPKEVLLVLDNTEHLLGAVVELVRALEAACPKLVVLATSREGLAIAGERIIAVTSLELPHSNDRDAVMRSNAAQLFVERAVAVKSDFGVTDANAAAIAEVVRRLDGIPLALELAAARVPVLSPAQLAQRLNQRFRLLAGGERGASGRHATLRAAIDWSYDLLADDQQRLLVRLSVFAGGCSLEAVEAVCSSNGIDEVDVLDLLAALVARSLVQVEDAATGERRYRLLETIRQYAEEHLDEAERIELGRRHARFYAELVESAAVGLRGPDQLLWLQRVDAELENLRNAMAETIADNDAVTAARFLALAADLERGPLAAALLRDTETVLELPGLPTLECYPFTLVVGAIAALVRGSYDRAEQLCAQALAAAEEANDELEGHTAVVRATVAIYAGDQSHVIEHLERALRHFRRVGNPYQLARMLNVLATIRVGTGELDTAAQESREALALARKIGNPGLTSCALAGLALALADSEPERSRALIAESLDVSLRARVVDELALVQTIGASAMLGERDDVLRLSARTLDRGLTATYRIASCLEPVAEALAAGAPALAAVLHGYIDALAPRLVIIEPYRTFRERATAAILAQLDVERVNELRLQGAAMSYNDAVAYGLDAISRVLREKPDTLLSSVAAAALDSARGPTPTLRRRHATWDITYRTEAATVVDSKGFRDLAILLSRPGVDVHVLELTGSSVSAGASIEMVDRTALAQYRQRLADLDDEHAEAERHHDTERVARAEIEREALLDELRTVSGLGGQPRLSGAHAGERARKAVSARIKNAIRHIETPMPQLAAHLDQAIVTGTWCRYRADMAENWTVET